ncbi:MAG: hypothetical protein HY925_16345 [Elusimicrobia bacterium]|nr:hypothetical protein [Elusimicrobiota bacterium]
MAQAAAAFSVLLPSPERLDAPKVARALSRFLNVPIHDAAARARRSCGIVAEGLSEEQAKDLAKRLEEEALGGWVLRDDALATVPAPNAIKSLELASAGFRPALDGAPHELIPSKAIRLVAAAVVDRALVLDIVLEAPLRRLRVNAERFDFRCLGGRMNYDARNNLRELARSLCSLSPAAIQGRGTSSLLADKRGEPVSYDALDDLDREERWLLTIA